MKQATLYKKEKDQIVCTACQWYCRIPKDFVGVCSVRANIEGKLQLLVHSRATSYGLDPIEKKPFFHFLPGSQVLSLGTYGCPLGCLFCQNWEISQTPKIIKTQLSKSKNPKEIIEQIQKLIDETSINLPPKKIVEDCLAQKAPSIAFTYNEPTIFAEYAFDTMKLARKHDLHGVFVSDGYESKETLDLMEPYIDAYNIDLKGATEEFYQKICQTRLKPVLENIEEIYRRKKWLEITTLLIPGLNTSQKDLHFIAKFIAGIDKNIPWHVTAFYPNYKMTDVSPTSYELLRQGYEIGKEEGLRYVYTGNLPGYDTESTYCPKCHQLLISREGFNVEVVGLNLETGTCQKCGEKISGVWK